MKVLIDNEWKEFEVEFGEPHPDGGVVVESEELGIAFSLHIGEAVNEIIAIDDETNYVLIVSFACADWEETTYYHARLSSLETHTYTTLV